jgi:polar amino acid transport system permease protein
MTDSYQEERAVDRSVVDRLLMNDSLLKYAGEVATGAFTLAIAYLLYRIFLFANSDLLVTIIPRFVDAYLLVVQVVVVSSILSVTLGVLIGLGRISDTTLTHNVTKAYIEFFRGTPLLFQLFVIYFGIPAFWQSGTFPIPNWSIPAAIIGLTLNHAAYVGEAVRGGINAVPDGQMEAARSLGMGRTQAMREIILPQAWRNALAAIGNDQIILVKDTSLLTVIAVPEIMSVFRSVNSNTFDPWTPIILVAVAYLGVTLPMGKLVRTLEARADWEGDRR